MFEFGRDIRKLFGEARDSDDLGWLELIGVELLAVEARALATDGGRVSCRHPARTWLRASALWREHARRTGQRDSLDRALATAGDAARAAAGEDEQARAGLARAMALLTSFDLFGDRDVLADADAVMDATRPRRPATVAACAGGVARIRARQARLSQANDAHMDAAALMDVALHAMARHDPAEADSLRLDNAALALEGGIARRDPRLLDQAGRNLMALVEACSPDTRPLTRARALALCGAGLSALAMMADDPDAVETGRAMFDAAADQFTPDHSPMDWAAIQVARATDPATPLEPLMQVDALIARHGTLLSSLSTDLLMERAVARATDQGDLATLARLEACVRQRLSGRSGPPSAIAWAVDQIAMARVIIARSGLTDGDPGPAAFILAEAAEVAHDHGVPVLADRARAMLLEIAVRA